MDAIDRKIVAALQEDARLTNQELSERIGLSPSPCLRRVRNLEREGVIQGYTAMIDQERYGLPITVFVSIRLERQTGSALEAFERRVARIDEVMECYLMTGNRDYLLRVVSDSLKSYERFVREVLTALPGVASIESSFAFSQLKQRTSLPAPSGVGRR